MKRLSESICAIAITLFLAPAAYGLCVKAAKANMRTGPGTNYEISWEVYRYMPFRKVGTSLSGDWYAVQDVDGDVAWIHKSLVTNAYRCAVVKEDVNVRTGPGTRYGTRYAKPAERYYSFRVLGRKGAWVRAKDETNVIGWIHRSFLWIQ